MSRVLPVLSRPLPEGSDLPVLLPSAERLLRAGARGGGMGVPHLTLTPAHGVVLLLVFLLAAGAAEAETAAGKPSIIVTLLKWSPLLLKGFAFNIAISFFSMAIGTAAGFGLGLGQISLHATVRKVSVFATHFFRNSPWLVLLFYCMFLLPFQFHVLGTVVPIPDWIKAVVGLALPVMANVAEILRGAVQSIPSGQWESANSLAFSRRQTIWMIILPQCLKRMLPPWMNLYAILTMSTVLASIVGVSEVMTLTGDVLAAENRPELLLPFYAYVLVWFFIYCYPIARWTVRLERRFSVNI